MKQVELFNLLFVTTIKLRIEFDPAKNAKNIRERGLSFERVADFNFETACFSD